MPKTHDIDRRALLGASAIGALAVAGLGRIAAAQSTMTEATAPRVVKYVPAESDYPYEVRRTEAEWRAHLGDDETYRVMREAGTEWPFSSDLWENAHPGGYACRGCELKVYDAGWFAPDIGKGWVFFHHAEPNSVMFGLDGPVREYGQAAMAAADDFALSEVHCRRCGSHLGHHLKVATDWLHCINGTSLIAL